MKKITAFLLLIVTLSFTPTAKDDNFYMPAEWSPHEAVWVGWEVFGPFRQPTINVIKALIPYVAVKVVTESKYSSQVAKEYLQMQGVDTSKIRFYIMKDNRVWLRDHGAVFLINKNKELGVADFKWTLYGIKDWLNWNTPDPVSADNAYKQALRSTGKVDSMMAVTENARIRKTGIVMEGGAIEVNGKGILILNETLTLARNPGMNKDQLATEFKKVLSVKKIIWLKRGLAEDPHIIRPITGNYVGFGTGGHTDEFVRFADSNTILLGWVDESELNLHPVNKMNYERMKENLKILEGETNLDGKPFRIIKVPLPDPIQKPVRMVSHQKNEWDDGIMFNWFPKSAGFNVGDTLLRVAAASYLNYFVTNGVVLLPTYTAFGSSSQKEKEVSKILGEVFPGRKLVFLDVMGLNYEGGGIHCITQQQPAK